MQLPPKPETDRERRGRRTKLIAISLEVRFYACLYCAPLFRWLILIDNKFNDQELDNREESGRVGCGIAPAEPDSHSGISWPAVRTTHPFEVDSLWAESLKFWDWRSSKYGKNILEFFNRVQHNCQIVTAWDYFNFPYKHFKTKALRISWNCSKMSKWDICQNWVNFTQIWSWWISLNFRWTISKIHST